MNLFHFTYVGLLDLNRIRGSIPNKEWIGVFLNSKDRYKVEECSECSFDISWDICNVHCDTPTCWSHPKQYPEDYKPGLGRVIHGCFANYKANSTYASRLSVTSNLLTNGVKFISVLETMTSTTMAS